MVEFFSHLNQMSFATKVKGLRQLKNFKFSALNCRPLWPQCFSLTEEAFNEL